MLLKANFMRKNLLNFYLNFTNRNLLKLSNLRIQRATLNLVEKSNYREDSRKQQHSNSFKFLFLIPIFTYGSIKYAHCDSRSDKEESKTRLI